MNIYFLVEGNRTEKKIYPQWLKYLVPKLKRVKYHDQVTSNNYYLISGEGYPAMLHDGLDNAIDKIQETKNYDYLVLCVDADEESVKEREQYIREFIEDKNPDLGKTEIIIIVQNRCIETWLLGNSNLFDSRQPMKSPLSEYADYYDVSKNDPELMGAFEMRNHADFHVKYLQATFRAKELKYTKKNPGEAQKKHYLEAIQKRVKENPTHLQTFQSFLDFCEILNSRIESFKN